jgi:hypothetical protein
LGTVYLWLKQDDVGVYFAVRNNVDQTLDDYDNVGLYFDDNHDGCFPASATTEGNHWVEYHPGGSVVNWRWMQDTDCGFPPDYICYGDDFGSVYSWSPTCFGIGIGPTGVVDYEIMIPYGAVDEYLDLTMPPDSLGFFIYCEDNASGTFQGTWPSQGRGDTWREPCYYGRLICSGQDSFYWKPPYEDYAPNGMPDIDQRQDTWIKYDTEQWSFCGPVAVANCFKWFDSKYNVPPGIPGDCIDQFPLVRQYIDPLGGMISPYDDHDPWNVDHPATSWNPGIGPPPPTVPQPFVPGVQPPGMPPWGELVERLAWYFNTDGIQTGYCEFTGTNIIWMQQGIDQWLNSEIFPDGSTLADTLCEVTTKEPSFAYVESLVEKCEDVILLLGFWYEDPPGSGEWWRIGGHYVTVAGVNSDQGMIAFSDPFIDAAELQIAPGRVGDGDIIPHPHGAHDPTVHNDEGNISHDIYVVSPSPSPGGLWGLPEYPIMYDPYYWNWNFFNQNVPDEFVPVTRPWSEISPIFTEVEYSIQISPWDYRGDVNVPGGDGQVNVDDVVFLISYLFRGGPDPWSFVEGDANCDGEVEVGDIVVLITYLFRYGPAPRCCDP